VVENATDTDVVDDLGIEWEIFDWPEAGLSMKNPAAWQTVDSEDCTDPCSSWSGDRSLLMRR